jgi:hypothetical protein
MTALEGYLGELVAWLDASGAFATGPLPNLGPSEAVLSIKTARGTQVAATVVGCRCGVM